MPSGPTSPEIVGAHVAESLKPAKKSPVRFLIIAAVAVIVLDIVAAIVVPPAQGYPDIRTNLEFIAPLVLFEIAPGFSITNTLFTMWLVMAVIIVLAILATRGLKLVPDRAQNFVEAAYTQLEDFGYSLGGEATRRYMALYMTLFTFIIFANWSGLLPFVGKVEFLRAPTSDINVTVGLAMVSFLTFHIEGARVLGVGTYLGKFFNLKGFRRGAFDGAIDLFVGLLEFVLEFFKPLTLSLRLFANIYGGELVIGVMTALLLALLPLPFLGLELFVGFMQALVFAVLTMVFTMIAIEPPHDVEGAGHEGFAESAHTTDTRTPSSAAA